LAALRRRYPERRQNPTEEEIENFLLSGQEREEEKEEENAPEEEHVGEGEELQDLSPNEDNKAEERIEETQEEHEEREVRRKRRVSFADEKELIESKIDVQVERKAESRSSREGQRTRKRRKISLVTGNVPSAAGDLTNKDVYIIEDNRNNQLYLTLKDVDGKFIMLKRQSGKKKRGYQIPGKEAMRK
jgi:hypothetical protein